MTKAAFIGAVAFLLGAASSPKAANDGELTAVLCKRFKEAGGESIMVRGNSFTQRERYEAEKDPQKREAIRRAWDRAFEHAETMRVVRAIACGGGSLISGRDP